MANTSLGKILAKNRRATFDYEISYRLVAGVVLKGFEAKSVRNGNVSLKGSFAYIKDNELWLNNVHIGQYSKSALKDYDPTRARKLLVSKKQLAMLGGVKSEGNSIVVLAIGLAGRYIKVELGVGRGKKKYDKRQLLKRKDQNRSIQAKLNRN